MREDLDVVLDDAERVEDGVGANVDVVRDLGGGDVGVGACECNSMESFLVAKFHYTGERKKKSQTDKYIIPDPQRIVCHHSSAHPPRRLNHTALRNDGVSTDIYRCRSCC